MAFQYAALAGYQIISGLQQAEMVGRQAALQKEIDDFNAQMAEYDAWKVQAYGQTMVAEYQQKIDQAEAVARVTSAAEGVNPNVGSISEAIDQNQLNGYANQMAIEAQIREKALGYTRQARDIRTGSVMNQGAAAAQQAGIKAGALLTGAGTAISGYMKSGGSTKPTKTIGGESGYSLPTIEKTKGSYLTGSSEDLGGTGYLMP